MPALQVRDFPEDLYETLRSRAKENHRSITQETIIAVERYLAPGSSLHVVGENEPREQAEHSAHIRELAERTPITEVTTRDLRTSPLTPRERRHMALTEIASLPGFDLVDGYTDAAALMREERACR